MTDTATGSDHGLAHIDALIAGAEKRLAAVFGFSDRSDLARSPEFIISVDSA